MTTRLAVLVFAVLVASLASGNGGATTSCPQDQFLLDDGCVACPQNSTRAENSTEQGCVCSKAYLKFTVTVGHAECLVYLPSSHWYNRITLKKILIVTGLLCGLFLLFVGIKYYRYTKRKRITRSAKYARLGADRGTGGMEELLDEEEDIELSIYEKK